MSCGTNKILSCGFNAGYANFTCLPKRETAVRSVTEHVYPVACPPTKTITIERVVAISGVDNALFLVGDVDRYKQGKNYTVEIPGEAVNEKSGNFPTYLLLKDGDAHTLGFSTGNIEALLRQNKHMFTRDGMLRADVSLFNDIAPQDQSVEGAENGCGCRNEREFKFRLVNNTTLNDSSVTLEITIFECGTLIDREIWFIIPCRCENGNTLFGANLLPWDYTPKSCGEEIFIPGRATDCGTFVFSNYPKKGCGCGHAHFNNSYVPVSRGGCNCGR